MEGTSPLPSLAYLALFPLASLAYLAFLPPSLPRSSDGQMLFHANAGQEESKHLPLGLEND